MQEDILARVEASTPRRWIGVGMLGVVGVLVIYVALAQPPALVWQAFLLIVGSASLWLAYRMWIATDDAIELTGTELRTQSGQVIATLEQIESVDRGVFAFKPSNGFLVVTRTAGQNSWAPGLWWRLGKRIGVGGMTSAAEAKFMSEALMTLLAKRS